MIKMFIPPLEEDIDVRKDLSVFFTNNGKEKSVYSVVPEKDGLKIAINFELTRIRPEIPGYGGICCLFSPPVSILSKQKVKIFLGFLDRNIHHITMELKKAAHTLSDDEKKYRRRQKVHYTEKGKEKEGRFSFDLRDTYCSCYLLFYISG